MSDKITLIQNWNGHYAGESIFANETKKAKLIRRGVGFMEESITKAENKMIAPEYDNVKKPKAKKKK